MMDGQFPRLCGGTFYTLLLREKRRARTKKQLRDAGSDGLAQRFLLKRLIMLFDPSFYEGAGTTFETSASLYASCEKSTADCLPFDDAALVNAFDRRIKSDYSACHSQMGMIADCFLATDKPAKMQELSYSLLNLIKEDKSISPGDAFYALESGRAVAKIELLALDRINLPALLLGIWHYILLNRKDNKIGRDTYISWHSIPDVKGSKHEFVSDIGSSFPHAIKIDTAYRDTDGTLEDEAPIEYGTVTDGFEPDGGSPDNKPAASPSAVQIVQNQFNFNFSGNGINIGRAENVVIKNGKVVALDEQ